MQNPTTSLADDVAATTRTVDDLDGPVVLVGHSYGGVVITEAGTHERVTALVYVTAFAPDKGESVSTLIADSAPGAPVPPILPGRRLPPPGPRQVRRVLRRRRAPAAGRVHGRLAGALGRQRPDRERQ